MRCTPNTASSTLTLTTVLITALLALATLTALAAPAAQAGTPAWSAGGRWLWQNPRPQGSTLNDVTFVPGSASRAWAVGDAGVLLKSTNGGTTWSRVKLPVPAGGLSALEDLSFTSALQGRLCDHEGNVYRTTDGGAHWAISSSGVTTAWAIAFADARHGWVSGNPGKIAATTDGGASWNAQSTPAAGTLNDITATSALDAWAVGDGGVVIFTTDGGANWTAQTSNTGANLESVTFIDAQHGWAGGWPDTVIRTTDGGATWVPGTTGHNFHAPSGLSFIDAQHGFASVRYTNGWTNDGLVLETTDGGANWSTPVQTTECQFLDVATPSTGDAVAVGSGGFVWRSVSGTWVGETSGTGRHLLGLGMADAANGWMCGYSNAIWHTTDGGSSWTPQTVGGNRWNAVCAISSSEAFAGGGNGLRHTSDAGATWDTQVPNTDKEAAALAFAGAANGWAVTWGGDIVHTTDGGTTWTPQTSGTGSNLWGAWAVDDNTAWAVGDGGLILHTTDAGANWTPQTSGTAATLKAITFASLTEGWVVGGASTDVWHTTDAGANWTTQPLPVTPGTYCYAVSFTSRLNGWIAAAHGQVFATTDGGATWTGEQLACLSNMAGIDAVSQQAVFAVGDNGTVVARDGARPATSAPSRASVRRRGTAKLKYKVSDPLPNGGGATVTIKIRTTRGKVVKTLKLGVQPLGLTRTAKFKCMLAKGTYRFTVYATDIAGNTQRHAAANRLTVK